MGRTIFDVMDEFFGNSYRPVVFSDKRSVAPMCNVMESEKEYTIQIAAPGLTKEDVQVKLDEDDALVISMQKKEEKKEEEQEQKKSDSKEVATITEKPVRYLRREFSHQSFVQRLLLPEDVNKEGITAKMENGMLEVIIPKAHEEKATVERMISIE